MSWTIRVSNPGRSDWFIPSTKRQDWLWCPPSLLFNRLWGNFHCD